MGILNFLTGRGEVKPEENFQEGAGTYRDLLKVTAKDDDLVKEINSDIENSKSVWESAKAIQDENEKYYLGTQLDENRFDYELPSDQNILYRNLETMIAIITSKRKEPIVLPAQDTDQSKDLSEKTQQFLSWKWADEDMSIKYEDWVRAAYLYRIGVFKIEWDKDKDDFKIENKRPQTILIDKDATDEYDSKFIVEMKQDSLGDLMDMFPKAKEKLTKTFGDALATRISYVEYWTNEFTVWKVNNVILDKKKNPNWNWEEKDRKGNLEKLKEKWTTVAKDRKLENVLINYFNEPRKPYVIVSLKNLGKSIYADTSDFEQSKRGQDIVNKRKRQIDKAAIHGLGRLVVSGSFITKDEAKKLDRNPNATYWMEKGNVGDGFAYTSPQPISPVILQDFQDTKSEIDNTMGVHGTTRGEQGPAETATGRNLLREGDMGRIDLAIRRIDKKLELLYAWMLQMAKVYYDETHYIKMLGKEGATTYLKFSQNEIEDGIEVIVKSELTAFKAEKRQEAQERMQAGLLDPLSYFEAFDDTEPKEKARRMVMYTLDPKMYLAQFLMDENTPGMENTPEGKAAQEQKALVAGEQVPPNPTADAPHIEAHSKFMKSPEFANIPDEIKQAFIAHIQAEVAQMRQNQPMLTQGQPEAPQGQESMQEQPLPPI
jgi:hypothetical protein